MRNQKENEDLFELLGRDGQTWLAQAEQLKMAADAILPSLKEAFMIPPTFPDAQKKRFAFFHSYMLLVGLAFENLTKGICIERDPTLVNREQVKRGILSRGGHGIAEGAKKILGLDSNEFKLLERVEEHLLWAGRYPIPLRSSIYHHSEVQELRSGRSDDPSLIDAIFQRLVEVFWREWKVRNRSASV